MRYMTVGNLIKTLNLEPFSARNSAWEQIPLGLFLKEDHATLLLTLYLIDEGWVNPKETRKYTLGQTTLADSEAFIIARRNEIEKKIPGFQKPVLLCAAAPVTTSIPPPKSPSLACTFSISAALSTLALSSKASLTSVENPLQLTPRPTQKVIPANLARSYLKKINPSLNQEPLKQMVNQAPEKQWNRSAESKDWLQTIHITHVFNKDKVLSDFYQDYFRGRKFKYFYLVITKWINDEKIERNDFENLIATLSNTPELYQLNVCQVAWSLKATVNKNKEDKETIAENFQNIFYTNQQIHSKETPSLDNDGPLQERFSTEVLTYFLHIFTTFSQYFPVTLGALCLSLKIEVSPNLPFEINKLLHQDLWDIPELTQEYWPEFIYYALMFVFQYALANPDHLRYSCAKTQLPGHLQQLGPNIPEANIADSLSQCATNRKKQLEVYKLANFNSSLPNLMKDDIRSLRLNERPSYLAFLCFVNCPPLKALFCKFWNMVPVKTSALFPSSNLFTLGHGWCLKPQLQERNIQLATIAISPDDALLLKHLRNIAKKSNNVGKTTTNTPSFPSIYSAPNMSNKAFFPPPDKNQALFNKFLNCVHDHTLKSSLFITTVIKSYTLIPVVNNHAVLIFLQKQINSNDASVPTDDLLKQFFKIIDSETLHFIIQKTWKPKPSVASELLIKTQEKIAKLSEKKPNSFPFLTLVTKEQQNLKNQWINTLEQIAQIFKENAALNASPQTKI